MKKLVTISLVSAALVSGTAFAATHEDVKADVKAIHKDNAAIEKQDDNIAENRAEKAKAKAEGDVVDQASESAQIGANKTVKAAKKVEKNLDEKILDHDTKHIETK